MTQTYIKRTCKFCKKTFDAYIYNIQKGFGKHCSKACSNKSNGLGFKKGHKGHLTAEHYKANGLKISKAKKGKTKFTAEHIAKLVASRKAHYDRTGRKACRGKKRQKKCHKCVAWRKAVFERDNYRCVLCGTKGIIEADHIKAWSCYPKLRHVITNGRTLCVSCHKMTPNYKSKAKTYNG